MIGWLDILKGFLPTLVVKLLFPDQFYFLLAGLAAVVGHNWPIYHRFKGGTGMSTAYGALLVTDWLGAIICSVSGLLFGFAIVPRPRCRLYGRPLVHNPLVVVAHSRCSLSCICGSTQSIFHACLGPRIKTLYRDATTRGDECGNGHGFNPHGARNEKNGTTNGFHER